MAAASVSASPVPEEASPANPVSRGIQEPAASRGVLEPAVNPASPAARDSRDNLLASAHPQRPARPCLPHRHRPSG